MADTKITDLVEETSPASADLVQIIDDVAGTPTNKKATLANVLAVSHNQAASTITSGELAHERGGLEEDVSAYDGYVRIASGATSNIKINFAGTTAPTANEDSGDGYSVGSMWYDTTNDKAYVCLDATVAAAVWTETTGTGGGGVTGPGSSTDNGIARFNGTGGDTLQDSGVTITDNDVLTLPDSATYAPLNVTERSAEPTTPAAGDMYLDDGTNTASGNPGWRRYTGAVWEDVSAASSAGAINDLTDVTITTPADNEVLAYDNGSGDWINQTPAEAGLAEASHTHAASAITSGQLALEQGGTEADLSATGPGALVQASSGASVTVETLDETRGGTGQTTITKGDLIAGSAADTLSKLAIGTDDYVLTADSAEATGMKWAAASSGGYTEGCRVYHSVAQSIPNSIVTALSFDSELYDTDTIHNTSTNNSRLTCQTAGKYLIFGVLNYDANITGVRDLYFQVNGTTRIVGVHRNPTSPAGFTGLFAATVWNLSASDYVEMLAYQTSGGSLNVTRSANSSAEFGMQRIG